MDEEILKNKLYKAFYWYYRHEYATVLDFFNEENNILKNNKHTTKKAEEYAMQHIQNLILQLEGAIYNG